MKETAAARQPVPLVLTPETEGYWPAERPYFYLAKKHIPTLEYDTVNASGRVTKEAAALFGITAQERRAIDSGISNLFSELQETERKTAHITNTPPIAQHRGGPAVSMFVPANPDVERLQKGLITTISNVLGEDRFGLFIRRASEMQTVFDSLSREGRIVTLLRKDENKGEVIVTTPEGTTFGYYDRTLEMDWNYFQYQHLIEALAERAK